MKSLPMYRKEHNNLSNGLPSRNQQLTILQISWNSKKKTSYISSPSTLCLGSGYVVRCNMEEMSINIAASFISRLPSTVISNINGAISRSEEMVPCDKHEKCILTAEGNKHQND